MPHAIDYMKRKTSVPSGMNNADEAAGEGSASIRESLNACTEADVSALDRTVRRELAERLKDLAEWDGDVLRLTDPNGTRPCSWREAGRVIAADLPAGISNRQLAACRRWVEDSSSFGRGGEAPPDMRGGHGAAHRADRAGGVGRRGRQHDLLRPALLRRKGLPIHAALAGGGGRLRRPPGTLGESWTNNSLTVQRFASKKNNIILTCPKYRSRRRIDGIYSFLQANKQISGLPLATEGESVMPASACAGSSRCETTDREERTMFSKWKRSDLSQKNLVRPARRQAPPPRLKLRARFIEPGATARVEEPRLVRTARTAVPLPVPLFARLFPLARGLRELPRGLVKLSFFHAGEPTLHGGMMR